MSLTTMGDNSNVRLPSVIYPDSVIGKNFTTGHYVLIREHCTIGDNVSVGSFTELSHDVTIGSNVRIHSQCFIPEGTIIEDDVWIGPRVCITNDKHPGRHVGGNEKELQPVVIEYGAVIGANATILPGVHVYPHAIIGAGAVVTKDVVPYTVVVGNPARLL